MLLTLVNLLPFYILALGKVRRPAITGNIFSPNLFVDIFLISSTKEVIIIIPVLVGC